MTCKDCLHYEVCGGFTPSDLDEDVWDYCSKGIPEKIPDIEERCNEFKDKANFVEVKHGEWVYWQPDGTNHLWSCSVCGGAISTPMKFVADHIKYCEHCGAKMDGERKCNNG